jgi:hypothetical protein
MFIIPRIVHIFAIQLIFTFAIQLIFTFAIQLIFIFAIQSSIRIEHLHFCTEIPTNQSSQLVGWLAGFKQTILPAVENALTKIAKTCVPAASTSSQRAVSTADNIVNS